MRGKSRASFRNKGEQSNVDLQEHLKNTGIERGMLNVTSAGSFHVNPARVTLIQKLIDKFSAKFIILNVENKQTTIEFITSTIKTHLEDKEHITPEIFD